MDLGTSRVFFTIFGQCINVSDDKYICIHPAMEPRRATLASMGLRSERTVARHILEENTWESNLVPDIAGLDYLAGHQGKTNLQPLEGLPPFSDDFYIYGPLQNNEIARVRGQRPTCTTSEEGSAKRVCKKISIAAQEVWNRNLHISIVHTVSRNSPNSRILETVQQIKAGEGYRTRLRWNELYPDAEEAAYFVAEVDVSELELGVLQKGLPAMQRLPEAMGFGVYQIDYTQDFAGTLDREALVRHLVHEHEFARQGEFAFSGEGGRILDNTDSVGAYVCTFVQTRNGRKTKTKFYNKDISQIEAGDIQKPFGGHLAHLVDSTNQHLRRTLAHPAVRSRGCTRVEISLEGCSAEDLSTNMAVELLSEALLLATPCREECCTPCRPSPVWDCMLHRSRPWPVRGTVGGKEMGEAREPSGPLPGAKDRPWGDIYLARSGHSRTGRTQGMLVHTTEEVAADDAKWKRAMEWTMADFGLRKCLIF